MKYWCMYLVVLLILLSCGHVQQSSINKLRYGDPYSVIVRKIGKKPDYVSTTSKIIVLTYTGSPNIKIYLDRRSKRLLEVDRDWDEYRQRQRDWAKAIQDISREIKDNYKQPTQQQPTVIIQQDNNQWNNVDFGPIK